MFDTDDSTSNPADDVGGGIRSPFPNPIGGPVFPSGRVEEITPAQASVLMDADILRHGTIPKVRVGEFVQVMKAGRWRLNGDPIVLSGSGRVLDGRVRLLACIHSGEPFRTLVIRDVPDDDVVTIDTLRTRKLSDILSISRVPHHRRMAAALRFLHAMRDGRWSERRTATNRALQALHAGNPELSASMSAALCVPGLRSACVSLMASLHHIFSCVDREAADDLFLKLSEWRTLPSRSPAFFLGRYLAGVNLSDSGMSYREVAGNVVQTWNMLRAGRMGRVRFDADADVPAIDGLPEGFTLPVGAPTSEAALDEGGDDDIVCTLAVVSPRIASELLATNPDGNRRIAPEAARKYARDMSDGNWRTNGQTIKIGRSGRMLDGQHRCQGAVLSGRSFTTFLVHGIDDDLFETFDSGSVNGFDDVLASRGVRNASRVAAAARWLWLMENGLILTATPSSNSELTRLLAAHPGLERTSVSRDVGNMLAPGVAHVAMYLFSRSDPEEAAAFFGKLDSGLGIMDESDPVHRLRQRMVGLDQDKKGDFGGMDKVSKLAMTIKAWNAFRRGGKMRKSELNWDRKSEAFPVVV